MLNNVNIARAHLHEQALLLGARWNTMLLPTVTFDSIDMAAHS